MAQYRIYNGAQEWIEDKITGPAKPLFGDSVGLYHVVSAEVDRPIEDIFAYSPIRRFSRPMMNVEGWEFQIVMSDGWRLFVRHAGDGHLEFATGDGFETWTIKFKKVYDNLDEVFRECLGRGGDILIVRMF